MRTVLRLFTILVCALALAISAADAQGFRPQASIECSRQADALGLHGRERKDFRADCLAKHDSNSLQATTTICIRPLFEQELKLRASLDGSYAKTKEIGDAINYLRGQFCRSTEENMTSDNRKKVGENCYEYSGMHDGERVYWGQCHD